MPTYAEMQTGYGPGRQTARVSGDRGELPASKDLQERNLIVPIVGDFAGPKALRSVGALSSTARCVVRAFYTSNVEQYLFRNGAALAFYANVATLPTDKESVFIRRPLGAA